MNVKSAFLNGILNKEAYVEQPKGFEDPHFSNQVFKLKKALYGLKQAPQAWYERLAKFLLENAYKRGEVYRTLFIKQLNPEILVVQIYVDDIVFGVEYQKMYIYKGENRHFTFQVLLTPLLLCI